MPELRNGRSVSKQLGEVAGNGQTLARKDAALFHERIPSSRIIHIEGAPQVLSAGVPQHFVPKVKAFPEESTQEA